MRHLKAPCTDSFLFDLESTSWWSRQLSPSALRHLREGWQGLFQRTILALLEAPAQALGACFDEELGRPTKELYALAGLLLIAEFKDWTIDQAAEAWSFDASVQFALNLPRDRQYLCARTLDNYRRLLREKLEVQEIFLTVTAKLVEELDLDIRKQRLDSTHVLSQMAQLGRVQLLAVTVRRFLTALRRRDRAAYDSLEEALRQRYEKAESRLFGLGTRTPIPANEALAQLAQDLAKLVERFAQEPGIKQTRSYLALARVFGEHCEVRTEQTVVVRARSCDENGGSARCLQNPSDAEAGYSGHKGPGHQVQLAQALPPRDAAGKIEGPGLVTACVPQSAAVRDNEALAEVLEQQGAAGLRAEQLSADTIYGSDKNVQSCAALGIELISPVCGQPPKAGVQAVHKCTVAEGELKARLAERRAQQETGDWQASYRLRSGIEGLHHALDVVTGLKQLRVRGATAVRTAVFLKVTGWNIQAAAKIHARRRRQAGRAGGLGSKAARGGAIHALRAHRRGFRRRRLPLSYLFCSAKAARRWPPVSERPRAEFSLRLFAPASAQ
jgi:Transposase DDE domain/Transposase domain (DUF772)